MNIDFKKEVAKHKDAIVKMIQEWVQIPSITADNAKCKEALKFGLKKAEELGFETETFNNDSSGHIKIGNEKEFVGILGHVDVVPVDEKAWTHAPFEGKIVDGEIWGRGTQDDKGPVVLALYALKILKDLNLDFKLGAKVILGTQEEGGDWSDIEDYFKTNPAPLGGFTPDSSFPLIYAEKSIVRIDVDGEAKFKHIKSIDGGVAVNSVAPIAKVEIELENLEAKVAEFLKENPKAGIKVEGNMLTFEGNGAHAKNPEKGHSAIWDVIRFANFIGDKNEMTELYSEKFLDDHEMVKTGLDRKEIDGHQTINTGKLDFDGKKFLIKFDFRCPNKVNLEEFIKTFTAQVNKFNVTVSEAEQGLFKDPKDPLITTLEKAYRGVTKDTKTPLIASGGGTYAKAAANTVAFGAIIPGVDESRVHQVNERTAISSALLATEVYCHALYDLLVNDSLRNK